MNLKTRTVLVALAASFALTVAKAAVGLVTMSMALLASALDSLMDVLSMSINLAAVRASDRPADDRHQFGHGKAEAIAGLFQAAFIAVSAFFLIMQAFRRMIDGYRLESELLGIGMIVAALIVSTLLAGRLRRAGECTGSAALAAGSLNYSADVWTNAGVLVALSLERWAGVDNADPIISILISLYIIVSAIRVGRDSVSQLMDRALPQENLDTIDRCIRSHGPSIKGYHRLRTRMVGPEKQIEFHLEVDRSLSFDQAHTITEQIIAEIRHAIPGAQVTAHTDPV